MTAANREATGRVEQARGAVEGLIAQADKLRAQVGALGRDLASNVPGSGVSAAAAAAEEPSDSGGAEPLGRRPGESAGREPRRTCPRRSRWSCPRPPPTPIRKPGPAEPPSNEELISQLRGASGSTGRRVDGREGRQPHRAAPSSAPSGSDLGAARLVAMNMALDGASRAEITARITAEFSAVGERRDPASTT